MSVSLSLRFQNHADEPSSATRKFQSRLLSSTSFGSYEKALPLRLFRPSCWYAHKTWSGGGNVFRKTPMICEAIFGVFSESNLRPVLLRFGCFFLLV